MSPAAPIFQVSLAGRRAAIFVAFGLFLLLALVAQRNGVRLSFDSYYYVEYAKLFRLQLPGSFGTAWPFGWPLLGTAATFLGLSAYHGLLACSALSVLGLVTLGSLMLPWDRLGLLAGTLVLAAGAGTFTLAAEVAGVLSEVPFALAFLAFALCLGRWPRTGAIFLSAGLAIAAFALRYAGLIALVALGGWLMLNWRSLRAAGRVRPACCAVGAAALIAIGLLGWNFVTLGKLSAHPPGGNIPPAAWPGIAADLGWSLPAALGGLGLRNALGFNSALRLPVGLVLLAAIIFLGTLGWRRATTVEFRAVGAVAVAYAAGMIALRCREEFDALYNGRTFVPLLFPLLLQAAQFLPSRRLLILGCGLLFAGNAALCVRGASSQIGGDIRPAIPFVKVATVHDAIAINDEALTLAAVVSARVLRPGAPGWSAARFFVLAAPPADREGHSARMDPKWELIAAGLLGSGRYTPRLNTRELVVLERNPSPN